MFFCILATIYPNMGSMQEMLRNSGSTKWSKNSIFERIRYSCVPKVQVNGSPLSFYNLFYLNPELLDTKTTHTICQSTAKSTQSPWPCYSNPLHAVASIGLIVYFLAFLVRFPSILTSFLPLKSTNDGKSCLFLESSQLAHAL